MATHQPPHAQLRLARGDPAPFVEPGNLCSFDPATNSVLVPDNFLAKGSTTTTADPSLQSVYTGFLQSFNACELGQTGAVPVQRAGTVGCSNVATASQAGVTQGLRQVYARNFDPRISIAYRPFGSDKTVVRAGFGIFTQTTLGPVLQQRGQSDVEPLTNVNTTPANSPYHGIVTPAFQSPSTSASSSVVYGGGSLEQANDPHFRDPQAAQWNLTVEHQLLQKTALRFSYVGMSGYRLPVTVDLNQIHASSIPWNTGATAGQYVDNRAPYQNWTLLMSSENLGHSLYEAGIVEVNQRTSHGLAFQANYTLAKNLSDAQGTDAPTVFSGEEAYAKVADRFNLKANRGNVVATPRHRVLVSGYQLPFGSGRQWSGPTR
jgi:hypothetical protein